jgi:NAD(P)-dependent dehydrogenase (short-subunit alcohol dehydrogenase family)
LAGKNAILTGACGVIGRRIAHAIANEGANVIVHFHRSAKKAESLCDELRAFGVGAWAVRADFREAECAEPFFDEALKRCACIDLLVNSASTFTESTLQEVTLADFQSAILVNAWAPFALGRAFSRRGSGCPMANKAIVNLLDSRIIGNDAAHTGYILSKHLLAAITDMMAMAFAPAVRVNAVAPGLITNIDQPEGCSSIERADKLPLRRPGLPHEIAETVVYLLKNESMTGQVIYIDSGRHLREQKLQLYAR